LKLDARTLLKVLNAENQPMGWRDLVLAFEVSNSAERRSLRNLLRGMVRSGELHQDHRGAYHPAKAGGVRRGVIEASGMTLSFQGLPLERQRGMLLRPGDEVSARVVGEEVHVLEVLARSSRPVVGITRAKGRYPYVESLSPDYKGRVSLINPDEAVDGETVAVEILGEERRALSGRIIEHLGGEGGVAQAVVTMINAHGIPTEWEPDVEHQLERLPKKVVPGKHPQRVSLIDTPLDEAIDVSGMKSGVYYLRLQITSAGGTEKLIKPFAIRR
jgi:ribonuclease R